MITLLCGSARSAGWLFALAMPPVPAPPQVELQIEMTSRLMPLKRPVIAVAANDPGGIAPVSMNGRRHGVAVARRDVPRAVQRLRGAPP